ncbi:protein TsetseEP-like isoform X2 [Pseudoliparis swirei]|uniref:protein TsetseEP-like isoform X2 n=1 Tax=Pseudoliparis swirei TaxID=2059687 RepID=UPI0024BD9DEA|nr:protein TsetseEP-like isoform X2 [Pseudoliparis swirei]
MDLDPAFLLPAAVVTAVVGYFAASLLRKKPGASAPSAGSRQPAAAPQTPAPAEKLQAKRFYLSAAAVDPVEELQLPGSEVAPEPVSAPRPETLPEPVVAPEPTAEPEPVPELESQPKPVADPEPVVESEPESEAVQQPGPVVESLPELSPGSAEDRLPTPEPVLEEPEPETSLDYEEVKFSPGKKLNKFETTMTKEESEEEHRAAE